jgi:hypothetical protein
MNIIKVISSLNRRSSFVARRSRDQEIKKIKKIKKIKRSRNQEDQEFHVQSTKTLSYFHHRGRFEDIHQQEYQA